MKDADCCACDLSFFLTLLTAFLGHHTDWLDILAPGEYRRKQKQRQIAGREDMNLPARTVVICNDKNAARKLVYLLSAFLPSRSPPTKHWNPDHQYGFVVPGTNDDLNSLSQSPPIRKSEMKREIRRTPSKLSIVEGVDESKMLSNSWAIPVSAHSIQFMPENSPRNDNLLSSSFDKRQLPIPVLSPRAFNSQATPAAVTPQAANLGTSFKYHDTYIRPSSSGSSTSLQNLRQALRRNAAGNNSGQSNESAGSNGWGSFISSIWSNPRSRGSFSGASSTSTTADEIGHIDSRVSGGKADEEFSGSFVPFYDDGNDDTKYPAVTSPTRWTYDAFPCPNFEESTLRYSVDAEGIIDVDIPLGVHGGFSGKDQSGSTPLTSSPTSTSYFNSSMESSLISLSALTLLPPLPAATGESESTGNVAGEVDKFHPDFVLQAVTPYPGLEEEILKALKAEPFPQTFDDELGPGNEKGTWNDISTTLVADTRTNQIRRFRLRRRRTSTTKTTNHNTTKMDPVTAPLDQLMADEAYEEQVLEDIVMDMDELLATAVESVISGVAPNSVPLPSSRSSSVASGRSQGRTPQEKSTPKLTARECRTMVLGALANVTQQIADNPRGVVDNVLTEGIAKWLSEAGNPGSV